MTALYWHTCGTGDRDLVLLHGWGLNAEVWCCIIERFAPHFRLHLVDLPGYGRSRQYGAMSLLEMADEILLYAPRRALWLGWSLGGLVVSQIVLRQPERVAGIITVSSSPCFITRDGWPGIRLEVLREFEQQICTDYHRTVERFLALQTLGIESARADSQLLKSIVLKWPMPEMEVMVSGLEVLCNSDLRLPLASCSLPFLRIYGYLDGLVPRKIALLLDNAWPQTQSVVMKNTAHAPFISHPDVFFNLVIDFSEKHNLLNK